MLRKSVLATLAHDTRARVPDILAEHTEVTNIKSRSYDGKEYPFKKPAQSNGSSSSSFGSSPGSPPNRRHTVGHAFSKSQTLNLANLNGSGITTIQESPKAAQNPPPPAKGSKSTKIRVVNMDTFDTAISMIDALKENNIAIPVDSQNQPSAHVAVLNLASDSHPGGGWLHGSRAQEEFLFYRSTLDASLTQQFYPFKQLTCLYTPQTIVFRPMPSLPPQSHSPPPAVILEEMCPVLPKDQRHVVSVITLAGLRNPKLARKDDGTTMYASHPQYFLTKNKIKTVLRVAKFEGCTRIVLGALGCGAFRNPPRDVAVAFREVFEEEEELTGCWDDVVFGVFDARNEGNFDVFKKELEGFEV